MDPAGLPALVEAIRHMHGCTATYVESVPVRETLNGATVHYREWMAHLQRLPVYALVTTGRTGSDFLQSLLDSHPGVLTFNGHFAVYSEFFKSSTCLNAVPASAGDVADEREASRLPLCKR